MQKIRGIKEFFRGLVDGYPEGELKQPELVPVQFRYTTVDKDIHITPDPPEDTDALWINKGKLHRWNGSRWVRCEFLIVEVEE